MKSLWAVMFMAAALLVATVLSTESASAQGYYGYESYYFQPRYQNNYHGYWRDLGYGFTNRPVYGSYYRQSYWESPYYGIPYSPYIYSVPSGPQRRR